jgi:hypothetical protein
MSTTKAKLVVAKTYDAMLRIFHDECRRLAEDTFHRYCRHLHEPLYLCGTKENGVWRRLSVASADEIASREFIDYVSTDPLSRAKTIEHMTSDFRTMLNNEPIWCFAD